jgi:MerR family transcriptional regulator, light-induced transcriptional regulator
MQPEPDRAGHLRIGELSRRVGVSTELLRAWEHRYSLLSPTRTAGGFRLYGDRDEQRVRRMLGHLASGVSAAEGARLTLAEHEEPHAQQAVATPALEVLGARLREALDGFDDADAHAALDELLSTFAVETVLRDAVLPYLHELGLRWESGEVSIGQEHFASSLLRGRMLGLARGWGNGGSPLALLACVPGDQHDLGLICFGLALRRHGWRIAYLGPDTPLAAIIETTRTLGPALVILTAATAALAADARDGLAEVARSAPLALAGAGVTSELAGAAGAHYLEDDPVTAAALVARGLPGS